MADSKWDLHRDGYTFRHIDGVRWQLQATRLLEALLRRSLKEDLPRLTWLISDAGASLTGQCNRGDVTAQRAAFNAWVDAIGATPWPERTDSLGTTHLRAVVERYQEPTVHNAWATVVIVAALFDQTNEDVL